MNEDNPYKWSKVQAANMTVEMPHIEPSIRIYCLLLILAAFLFCLEFIKQVLIEVLKDTRTYVTGQKWRKVPFYFAFSFIGILIISFSLHNWTEELNYPLTVLLTFHKHGLVRNSDVDMGNCHHQ